MDAFIEAVERARRQLMRDEGHNVSVREVLRRAGYDERERGGVSYHLNAQRHTGDKPHNVPPDLVRRLAAVLPITEEELTRAARVAAGFNVVDSGKGGGPDVATVVQRFYGDENVPDVEKQAVTARLMQILGEELQRQQRPQRP